MKKLKILELTAFSAGFCGLWTRVLAEASCLSKNHNLFVFSSNILRGEGKKSKIAQSFEKINNVKIYRFPTFGSFGKNTFFWNYKKQALNLKPDIIITHAYRQYYSTKALTIAKKLKIPCILITHAPFLDKKLRNWKLNIAVYLYDSLIGKRILNKYSKIFAITKWEVPYLLNLGIKEDKIVYVPNGIPEEFFKYSIKTFKNKKKKILFLGRIAPIKDIITLIKSFAIVKQKYGNVELDIVGPIEEDYQKNIDKLVDKLRIKINFLGPVYDLNEKIKIIDSADIFVLPSKREAMPQALIEAMARKKLVISSKTEGGLEIVKHNQTGFLFDIGDERDLTDKILFALDEKNIKQISKIKENAFEFVKQFSWDKLIKKIENQLNTLKT